MKKLTKVTPPRYDDVFFDGVRWMDWLARTEDMAICVYFQRNCDSLNCPCDFYRGEETQGNEEQAELPTKNQRRVL